MALVQKQKWINISPFFLFQLRSLMLRDYVCDNDEKDDNKTIIVL